MPHLKVSSSIISNTALQDFLQSQYNFQSTIVVQLLKAGINHSYLLRDGKTKYIFRVYTIGWRTKMEISAEVKLLKKLKKNNIAVSHGVLTKKGNYILELTAPEGLRYGVLFSFASGTKQLKLSEAIHSKVGIAMAKFHQLTEGEEMGRIKYSPQNILRDPLEKLQSFLPKESAEIQWMVSVQKELLKLWSSADQNKIRKGAVHLDIWPDNLHISENSNVTLFDFDFLGYGWQCMDIAYYLMQLYAMEKEPNVREAKEQAFMEAYESIQVISDEERRLLPMLGVSLYYFYLGVQCERYDDWSNVFINEVYLKRYIQVLVKGYYSNHF